MDECENIVRLHARQEIGKQLESQWQSGSFQNIPAVCQDGSVQVNALLLGLASAALGVQIDLSYHDLVILPDCSRLHLTTSIKSIIRSASSLHAGVKCERVVDAAGVKAESNPNLGIVQEDVGNEDIDVPDETGDLENFEEKLSDITENQTKPGKSTEINEVTGKDRTRKTEKRSLAWKFYKVVSPEQASCHQCTALISTKLGSTKGLLTHLKAYHTDLHKEYLQSKVKKKGVKDKPKVRSTCEAAELERISSQPEDEKDAAAETGKSKYRLCTECGKSVQNMWKHLKMHRGIKPDRLQCHICEKTLCTNNALKVHIETVHDGIRRYSCKFCNNSFIYASHLKTHILVVHQNFKNPKAICPDCGKQFKFISTMKRHQRVVHLGEKVPKRHYCSQCRQVFNKESQLTGHLRERHGITGSRRKPGRTRDNLVDQAVVLEAYPDLVKPEDLEF